MGIQDQIPRHSKIQGMNDNSSIHNLFIFNRSGICFYGKDFTHYFKMEKNLISPFITALMSFSKEMIGKKFRTIEMRDVKFVIFERGAIIYNILCDSIENEIYLEEIVSKINTRLTNYLKKKNINIDDEIIFDSKLREVIDNMVNDEFSTEFLLNSSEKIIEYLKDLILIEELDGIILLTDKGKLIYTSYNKLDVKNFLKEVDFRVKIYNNSILKLFYTLKDKRFIFSEYIQDKCLIILVFNQYAKFGVAACHLNQIVSSVKKHLSN